jgi:hypothetical protein
MVPENEAPNGTENDDANHDDAADKPLGEGGEKALKAERERARKLEREHKAAIAELAALKDAGKSEQQKAADNAAAAEARAAKAEAALIRLEVAAEKGLTPAQAKRLVGDTREDLEADADELIESFGKGGSTPPPNRRPQEKRPGTVPDADTEEDPEAIVAKIIKQRRGGL